MDKIRIKRADSTFYPSLEDGKPEKKNISLTTVKDNQTTVHVDLFRSPSGTMQDAQYIDTLEIDSLNPHTNGEPNLNFDIALGEDGALSAEIHDPETGKQSSRQISLSSLAGVVAEQLPKHESDFSLKDDEDVGDIDEPIELGKRQDRSLAPDAKPEGDASSADDVKDIEDIFKAPEEDASELDKKADSSFDEIVNDISNIGKDADSQEESEVIGPSPNREAFSFDDVAGDGEAKQEDTADESTEAFSFDELADDGNAKQDEVADESIEEISAEDALPKNAEFVDSTGDEAVDTIGVLDASLDQPDFGFKDLADKEDQEDSVSEQTSATDGFEDLGTLPDWSTGGLDNVSDDADLRSLPVFADDDDDDSAAAAAQRQEDEAKTASDDENLDMENKELASFFDDAGESVVPEPTIDAGVETETEQAEEEVLPSEELAEPTMDAGAEAEAEQAEEEVLPSEELAEPTIDAGAETETEQTEEEPLPSEDLAEPTFVSGAEQTELLADLNRDSLPDENEPTEVAENTAGADDDFGDLDLPSLNLFEDSSSTVSEDSTRSSSMDDFDSGFEPAADLSATDTTATADFELPDLDFDDSVKEEADVSFSMPDFDNDMADSHASAFEDFDREMASSYSASSSSAFDDFDSTLSSTSDWPSLDLPSDSSASYTPSHMFDDLYDKETIEGKSSDGYEDVKRSSKVPMLVCIICAVICILCLFFLFVIPTKFNVLRRGDSQEIAMNDKRASSSRPEGKSSVGGNADSAGKEKPATDKGQEAGGKSSAGELIKPASTASVSAPLPKVESVPAKENEIVIASVPSVVVPETPVKNAKQIPDIKYTVVWGDTLWDIANAYYKNPWKYTELAEYNHLKNPNFIQTGSTLLIPAE